MLHPEEAIKHINIIMLKLQQNCGRYLSAFELLDYYLEDHDIKVKLALLC